MSKWKIGIYLRLSSDDSDKDESNSIINQRNMIMYYLKDYKDIKVYKEYIDDGYTGTDFNRPGIQQLIEDIYSKKINAVIVKDSSRLGRNYIKVGEFFEKIISKFDVRFISINDRVDSYLDPESMTSLEMSIKTLMNEGYSKDTSNKIRSSFASSKKHGNFIGTAAPFGYVKDEEDCHKFIIDKDAAEVVKMIFNMVIEGKSKKNIVDRLNRNNILTPSSYFKNILKYKNGINTTDRWNTKMLDYILRDETYIGNLVQGRRQRINHKTHNFVRVAEDDWIISVNHHKPIISEKVFNQVQDILYNRNIKVKSDGSYATYAGHLKCYDCKCNLYRKTKKATNKTYYYCGTYIRTHKCSKHYITEDSLNEIVLTLINQFIDMLSDLKNKIELLDSTSNLEYDEDIKKFKIIEIEKEIEKQEILINQLLDDYKNDLISKEDFEDFHKGYLFDLNNLRLERDNICKEKNNTFNINWLNEVKNLNKIPFITKSVIDEFIDNIYIKEDNTIIIDFKFKEPYKDTIEYLKSKNI